MQLPMFTNIFSKSNGKINNSNLNGMRVDGYFSRLITRERARVDRGGSHFSIIDFNIVKLKPNNGSAEFLFKFFTESVRITDEVCWIKKHRIGVLLFNTGKDDACRFAAKICDELIQTVDPLEYSVFTYPADLLDFDEDDEKNDSGRKEDDFFNNQNLEPSGEDTIKPEFSSRSQNTENSVSDTAVKAVKDISPLIVKKVPLWKRCIDIIISSIALVIFFPLFIVIGLLIKIVSQGPVFFKQERIGYAGKKFNMFKFRTMQVNADTNAHKDYLCHLINGDKDGENSEKPMTKLDECDSQIIPFGKFLRNTCLDELPQLINVLRGDMCLVGPRPPIPYESAEYLSWHKGRFDTLPGMTGLWQVSGKNRLSFKEMIRLDIRYIRNISIWSDLKIILKTPWIIIQEFKFKREQGKSNRKGTEQNV